MMKTPSAILLLVALLGSYEAHPVEGEDYPADTVHAGVCPAPIIPIVCFPERKQDMCGSDSGCAADEKCCYTMCHMICRKSLPDAPHPGKCPIINYMCKLPLHPSECQSDSECLMTHKCCNVCGNKCVTAVKAHAGSCPPPPHFAIPIACIPRITQETCQDDSSCAEDEKCCKTVCSNKCVKST